MSLISAGQLRRLAHPILLRYWLKRGTNRVTTTRVGGFTLRVLPGVFHPKYFGSSLILANYLASLDLRGKSFLDMGTGSGIVGLFAARAGARVTGVDINPQSVRCATDNAVLAGFDIDFRQSDLFSGLQGERFDVIAWNPPFFPRPPRTIAEAALYAGDRHSVIERFARDCRTYLANDGRVILVLSLDINVDALELVFQEQAFSVRRASIRNWGFGEKMVVLEIQ